MARTFSAQWLSAIQRHIQSFPQQSLLISEKIPIFTESQKSRTREAAVFVPLCNRHFEPSVLLTLRTQTVGSHKGQVSFPGGHIEPGESAIEASIRETVEELGIPKHRLTILGTCQTVPAITGTLVTPVIGFINDDVLDFEDFSPATSEVSRIFSRSLSLLEDTNFRSSEILTRDGNQFEMPRFGVKGDEECIWGLTAMILAAALDRAVIPARPLL